MHHVEVRFRNRGCTPQKTVQLKLCISGQVFYRKVDPSGWIRDSVKVPLISTTSGASFWTRFVEIRFWIFLHLHVVPKTIHNISIGLLVYTHLVSNTLLRVPGL